ncbi:hypothetical protein IKG48_02625 [Candidatus Saccharibacteria bacterium]|nr:hypothetical protein [Candidatus Saccharibacteria bacterium]
MSKISKNKPKVAQKRHKCPKCGAYYTGYPALSRDDNKTEICPECGVKEAIGMYDERSLRFSHPD